MRTGTRQGTHNVLIRATAERENTRRQDQTLKKDLHEIKALSGPKESIIYAVW